MPQESWTTRCTQPSFPEAYCPVCPLRIYISLAGLDALRPPKQTQKSWSPTYIYLCSRNGRPRAPETDSKNKGGVWLLGSSFNICLRSQSPHYEFDHIFQGFAHLSQRIDVRGAFPVCPLLRGDTGVSRDQRLSLGITPRVR